MTREISRETKEIHENRHPWVIANEIEVGGLRRIQVDGFKHQYTVLKRDTHGLPESLPYAVRYIAADKSVVVTETCPEIFRPYVVRHEVRENNSYANIPEPERCAAVLRMELSEVAEEIPEYFKEYVNNRLGFFEAMVEFSSTSPDIGQNNPEFIESLKKSSQVLTDIQTQYWRW